MEKKYFSKGFLVDEVNDFDIEKLKEHNTKFKLILCKFFNLAQNEIELNNLDIEESSFNFEIFYKKIEKGLKDMSNFDHLLEKKSFENNIINKINNVKQISINKILSVFKLSLMDNKENISNNSIGSRNNIDSKSSFIFDFKDLRNEKINSILEKHFNIKNKKNYRFIILTNNSNINFNEIQDFYFHSNQEIENIIVFNLMSGNFNFIFDESFENIEIIDLSYYSKINFLFTKNNTKNNNLSKINLRNLNSYINYYSIFIDNLFNSNLEFNFKSIKKSKLSISGNLISDENNFDYKLKSNIDFEIYNLNGELQVLPGLTVLGENSILNHSLRIKDFDKNELFYLSSKGFEENISKKLILENFFSKDFELDEIIKDILSGFNIN